MNIIGKPLKRLRIKEKKKGEIRKDWYRIEHEDFPEELEYSGKYSYIPHKELKEAILEYLEKNNIKVKLEERTYGYKEVIDVHTDIKFNDNSFVFFRIVNSTDKTRSFMFRTFLKINDADIPLVPTSFLLCLSYKKKHVGEIKVAELLSNVKRIIKYVKENIDRIEKYIEILKTRKINFKYFNIFLHRKKENGEYEIPETIRKKLYGFVCHNFYRWRKNETEYISVLDFLTRLVWAILVYTPSQYDIYMRYIEKFLALSVFFSVQK